MTSPRFSIIIPAYNRSQTIGHTLDSVSAQSFADFECIVVDDGSLDGAQLEQVVTGRADDRFRYIHRPNGGGGAARNTGIRTATGQFIAFLDSDDLFLPDKLRTMDAVVCDDDKKAYYSYMLVDRGVDKDWVRPDRPIAPGEDVGEYLFVANQFIQTSTLVLKRETALRVPFDDNLRKGQDLDLCVKLAAAGVTFHMIEEPLTIWVDTTEAGRTSRASGASAPQKWLEASRHLLTPRAIAGYEATVLAYYIGWSQPLLVLRHLWKGYFYAGVPLSITVRQALRTFMPRELYRWVVGHAVSLAGRKRAQPQSSEF